MKQIHEANRLKEERMRNEQIIAMQKEQEYMKNNSIKQMIREQKHQAEQRKQLVSNLFMISNGNRKIKRNAFNKETN